MQFWDNILRAVGTEPREMSSIRGASGFSHQILALGVDEERRRVVIVSCESDARIVALAQGDIQASLPSIKVSVIRPAAVNLGQAAKLLTEYFGNAIIGNKELEWLKNKDNVSAEEISSELSFENVFANFALGESSIAKVSWPHVIKETIQQLSLVNVQKDGSVDFDLSKLRLYSPVEADREIGVCALPLYEFEKEEVDMINTTSSIDDVKELLLQRDVYQYFFPAPDQLALGLAEKSTQTVDSLVESLSRAPLEGHPFGQNEIIDSFSSIKNLIPELQERGLLVEGEMGLDISEDGRVLRSQVKFKPREGVVNKLSKIFSVKVDLSLKDIFGK